MVGYPSSRQARITRTAISPRFAISTFIAAHCTIHAMADEAIPSQRTQILSGVVQTLLDDLKSGTGDKDRRRQVEEWMRTLAEKYPEFNIEVGLRDYYLAEAQRLRADFDQSAELQEKLALGRNIAALLDRAADYDRRIAEK